MPLEPDVFVDDKASWTWSEVMPVESQPTSEAGIARSSRSTSTESADSRRESRRSKRLPRTLRDGVSRNFPVGCPAIIESTSS